MTSVVRELYRQKTWATLRLIDLLRGVPQGVLDATYPGTYGSIRATLRHLVANDAVYYAFVTQQPPLAPLSQEPDLDEIAAYVERLAPLWEALLDDAELPNRELSGPRGTALAAIPLAQSIHHGDVHRTHILSILGAQGIAVPDLDMWEYGMAAGSVRPPQSTSV
jgi:uncharacterized damage-inducible protein DinB